MFFVNKKVLLFLLVDLICLNLVFSISEDEEAWISYKTKFNKSYSTPAEDSHRMKIFIENRQFILSHNVKSKLSFTQGLNHLSDLTPEEINNSLNGFRLDSEPERQPIDALLEQLLNGLNRSSSEYHDRGWLDDVLTPPMIDFRILGLVSKVKDQGSCGSCWAFATTGAIESILAFRNRSTLLSEQNLVDCSRRYGNHGCGGGLMDNAFRYVRDRGIMASHDYPYTGKDERCKFVREKSVTRVRGSVTMPRGNEGLLRLFLALTGPIPVAIDASGRSFHSYKSGVYNDDSCSNRTSKLNHAVLLVGYGTDKSGGDYWIVKNSWGNKWGDRGYIKMARNRGNLCGIASYAVLPLP